MPSWQAKPHAIPLDISGFSNRPIGAFTTRDLVVVLESEDDVVRYQPNFDKLIKIDEFHAVIVTAQSKTWFLPQSIDCLSINAKRLTRLQRVLN